MLRGARFSRRGRWDTITAICWKSERGGAMIDESQPMRVARPFIASTSENVPGGASQLSILRLETSLASHLS